MRNVSISVPGLAGSVTIAETTPAELRDLISGMATQAPTQVPAFPIFQERDMHRIVSAILRDEGDRILAIKFVRGAKGWGLRESKDWVDNNFPNRG